MTLAIRAIRGCRPALGQSCPTRPIAFFPGARVERPVPGLHRRRVAAVVALLAVAGLGAVAAQQAPGPFVPLDKTYCIICHATWTPPLKQMVAVVPPPTTGAPVGTEFDYTVTFQEAWNPKPAVPELQFVRPYIDITDAPSLRFGGAHAPIHLNETRTIAIDRAHPTEQKGNVSLLEVPPGAVSLAWTVTPADRSPQTGPVLTLSLANPDRNVTLIEAPGPGQPVTKAFSKEELAKLPPGNWSVGALVTPLNPLKGQAPQVSNVDFTVRQDATFDTESLRVLPYPSDAHVRGGGVHLQRWVLRFAEEPKPGEQVRIGVDATAFYKHKQPEQGGDYGNVAGEPLAVPVQSQGGKPVLFYEAKSLVARPAPVNGPTTTTVSEAVGYASAFLLVSSIVSGGMFGQASRRSLNAVFVSAKRRVAYHNFLSYGLSVAALVHMALFLIPMIPGDGGGLHRPSEQYQWTLGVIWGGGAILSMFGLGVTGAFQVPMIRRWSYPVWKWWHYGLTVAVLAFTVLHMLLDGAHFPQVQEAVGWKDPFYTPQAGV